jgi:hypothetical protein
VAIAATAAGAAIVWLAFTSGQTLRYIQPVLALAIEGLRRVLAGERPVKPLFAGDPTLVAPVWERLVGATAAVLVAAAVLGALAVLWPRIRHAGLWRHGRGGPLLVLFALAAAAYVPMPALRLVKGTTEIANRAADFLFLPIGVVVALAWIAAARHDRFRSLSRPVMAAVVVVVIAGGVIIGMPRWARLPGPYLVSGDTRAIQPESQAASSWLLATYGPHQAVAGDLTNTLLMGSYGRHDIVHGASWVFFRDSFSTLEIDALRQAGVRFLVIDRRLTTALPVGGVYFESGEPDANRHVAPLDPGQLDRIDLAGLDRVYDSGNVVIYAIPPEPGA